MKSIRLSVGQNVPHVPERPQRLGDVGHHVSVCLWETVLSGGIYLSIYEECTVETLNKPKPLDPSVEVSPEALVDKEDG